MVEARAIQDPLIPSKKIRLYWLHPASSMDHSEGPQKPSITHQSIPSHTTPRPLSRAVITLYVPPCIHTFNCIVPSKICYSLLALTRVHVFNVPQSFDDFQSSKSLQLPKKGATSSSETSHLLLHGRRVHPGRAAPMPPPSPASLPSRARAESEAPPPPQLHTI